MTSIVVIILGLLGIIYLSKQWGKQEEKAKNAKKSEEAALDEAQRHADTPVTPIDAAKRLRKRAKGKRKAGDDS